MAKPTQQNQGEESGAPVVEKPKKQNDFRRVISQMRQYIRRDHQDMAEPVVSSNTLISWVNTLEQLPKSIDVALENLKQNADTMAAEHVGRDPNESYRSLRFVASGEPDEWLIKDDKLRGQYASVKINVTACDEPTREGLTNYILNRANHVYNGADYHSRIQNWDKFSPGDRLFVLLSDWGDSLDCERILEDIKTHIPELKDIALSAELKMEKVSRGLHSMVFGDNDDEN